jgi:phycocyanobilin:ferredoxin oxidoreductase
MSAIFDTMYNLSSELYLELAKGNREIESDSLKQYSWTNRIFRGDRFRRGHLEVLDVRESKKMWIMHICIFPHLDDSSPIFGFDVICGANKITGVFLDFSMAKQDHPMNVWFADRTKSLVWKKDRELPDWGKRIFSPNMIAAGQVNTDGELNQVIDVAKDCFVYYINNVGNTIDGADHAYKHNIYCKNQKENVHTSRFLINCGYSEDTVKNFIDDHLFPTITV